MRWPALVLASALLALAPGAPVLADAHDRARSAVQAGEAQPLGAVLPGIQQRYPGRALSADVAEERGDLVYRIKWLGNDGKVRDITVDARSGRILNVR
jgi:uncharacterized membrane protein YkoI